MKKSIFAVLVSVLFSSFAHAGLIGIENNTSKEVSVGNYRGWKLPSICESTGYSFCWEEVFEKFKPLSKKHKNIQGTILTDLESQERAVFLLVDGEQIELLTKTCDNYDLGYVQPISGKTPLSTIENTSVCVDGFEATIIID